MRVGRLVGRRYRLIAVADGPTAANLPQRHGDQQCHIVGQCRKLSGGVFIVQACAGLNGMQLGDKKLVVQRASVGKNPGSVRDMMLSCVWIISPVDIVPLSECFDTQ